MAESIKGQCLCGNVRYLIDAKPKRVGCCYCKSCQIKSGSDHLVYLACESTTVTIQGNAKWYKSIGDSGLSVEHGFCAECGSTLFGKPSHWPHLTIVYAGSLQDKERFAPQVNLWVQDAPSWSCIDTNLQQFEKNP